MLIDYRTGILKADVSSVSPSSERMEELLPPPPLPIFTGVHFANPKFDVSVIV